MKIDVYPVETKAQIKKFIKSQWLFYKNDEYWVPPIISDRVSILDKKKNPFYQHSDIQMFIAESESKIVGRIAAITNDNHNKTHNDKVGFFGFYESINNQDVANALYQQAAEWLQKKGMNIIRGPENPSMNDEIGFLAEGFDSTPLIMMSYNPQYYLQLAEGAGFSKVKDVFAYRVAYDYASEKLQRLQNIVRERNKINIRQMNFKDKKQFAKDVSTLKYIYNAAWEPNWGFVRWTDEEFDKTAADLKMIANPKLTLIAEADGEIAGMGIALPNTNECMIHNKNGSTIGALWHFFTKRKKITSMRIIALGIIPKFQKSGIDSVLYYEIGQRGLEAGMNFGEASWILEDNVMMNRGLSLTMNGTKYKTYRLFEKKI